MARAATSIALAAGALLLAADPVALPGHAFADESDIAVDIELVLAVDVSRSMMAEELAIQRRGYVEALADPSIASAILGGRHKRVALTYVEWSGNVEQRVVLPWRLIASADDARRFSEDLDAAPANRSFRTSVSSALRFSAALFDGNGFASDSRIIDISGDGANNDGGPVEIARDEAVASGITINGLPIVTGLGLTGRVEFGDVDGFYRNCVIGGPGAFAIAVREWPQFGEAVRRKLQLELSGARIPEVDAASPFMPVAGFDCLAGERLWNLQHGRS